MRSNLLALIAMSLALAPAAFAAESNAKKEEGPCKKIVEACEGAGFVKGQAKEGNGLWVDCIDPIVKGTPQPKKATKPLPSVDAQVVAACKAKHPGFGEGHKGKASK